MGFIYSVSLDSLGFTARALAKILPAYVANATATVLAKFNILGLKRPIDSGRYFFDGRRILGDGKTWQGLILGTLAGTTVGAAYLPVSISFLLALGALLGDIAGSFLKRRLGLKRGQEFWLLDSLDFLAGAIILSSLAVRWNPAEILFLAVITPFVHRGANVLGYILGLKSVPW